MGNQKRKKELTEVRHLSLLFRFWWLEGLEKILPYKAGTIATHSLGEEGGESQAKKQHQCVWQMISSQTETPWNNVCPPVSVSATDKA